MASNALPDAQPELWALATDMLDGVATYEQPTGVAQNTSAKLATEFDLAKKNQGDFERAGREKDAAVTARNVANSNAKAALADDRGQPELTPAASATLGSLSPNKPPMFPGALAQFCVLTPHRVAGRYLARIALGTWCSVLASFCVGTVSGFPKDEPSLRTKDLTAVSAVDFPAPSATSQSNFEKAFIGWDLVHPKLGDQWFLRIRYLNGRFVAVGRSGSIAYSEDGETWVLARTPSRQDIADVAYANGFYLAVGNVVLRSRDLETWESVDVPGVLGFTSVASNGSRFVLAASPAVGAGGAGYAPSMVTDDGVAFIPIAPRGVVAYGNNRFVFGSFGYHVGTQNYVLPPQVSADGLQWTQAPAQPRIWSFDFLNGQFVGVGDRSAIITSLDGVSWAQGVADGVADLRAIAHHPSSGWIAVGLANEVFRSSDAIFWRRDSEDLMANAPGPWPVAPALAVGAGGQVIAATRNGLAVSRDGRSFRLINTSAFPTDHENPNSLQVLSVIWDGKRFVAATAEGEKRVVFYESAQGRSWTKISECPAGAASQVQLVYGNGVFLKSEGGPGQGASDYKREVSADLLTWESTAVPGFPPGSAFGDPGLFIDGYFYSTFGYATPKRLVRSSDGRNWQKASELGITLLACGASDGANVVIYANYPAPGSSGVYDPIMLFSPDQGGSWFQYPLPGAGRIGFYSIGFGGGRFVTFQPSGFSTVLPSLLTSTNALSWTSSTLRFTGTAGFSRGLESIAWTGFEFIATGGITLSSRDGLTWTPRDHPPILNPGNSVLALGNKQALLLEGSGPRQILVSDLGERLAEPQNVRASIDQIKRIELSWQPVAGAVTYRVYRGTSDAFPLANGLIASGITSPTYADTTATPGTNYTYWVAAETAEGHASLPGERAAGRALSEPAATPTPSPSPSASPAPTSSPTPSPSASPSPTISPSPTPPPQPSPTAIGSPTPITSPSPSPLSVQVAGPSSLTVSGGEVTIRGTASSSSIVVLVAVGDGNFKPARGTSAWTFTARVPFGTTRIRIVAGGEGGQVSGEQVMTVTRPKPPTPKVTVDGRRTIVTRTGRVSLSGTATAADGVYYLVNGGRSIRVQGTRRWKAKIRVPNGNHIISVFAVNDRADVRGPSVAIKVRNR